MINLLNISRIKIMVVLAAVSLVAVLAFSSAPAQASPASSCYNYSVSHGGGGCVSQGLYRNRYGVCSVLRANNGAAWFGPIWQMTAPCTR